MERGSEEEVVEMLERKGEIEEEKRRREEEKDRGGGGGDSAGSHPHHFVFLSSYLNHTVAAAPHGNSS